MSHKKLSERVPVTKTDTVYGSQHVAHIASLANWLKELAQLAEGNQVCYRQQQEQIDSLERRVGMPYAEEREPSSEELQARIADLEADIAQQKRWASAWKLAAKVHRANEFVHLGHIAEQLRADAEIGRLVKGMRFGSRITRRYVGMYESSRCVGGDVDSAESWINCAGLYDPAEALRVIQREEGNA